MEEPTVNLDSSTPNDVHQAAEHVAKVAEEGQKQDQKPKRRLRAAFFLLGMGMMAFTTATQNCTDYFNRQYQGLEPMRVISLLYNTAFMLLVFVLFFTPNLWLDKRARMFWGFVAFLCSVVAPALVEGLLNAYQSGAAVRYGGFIAWGVASACAGAADAVVASVVNGEASACKCHFHAALGRTFCSLVMVSLRCITKATIGASQSDMLLSMRKSASAHVVVTVALLLACVLTVSFVLPRLVQQVEDAESVAVPPGLTFQQTLNTALSAYESGAQADAALASLRAAGNLSPMHPGMDSVFGLPMFSVRQSAERGLSFHYTSGEPAPSAFLPSSSTVMSVTSGMLGVQSSAPRQQQQQQQPPLRQSTMQRYVAEHAIMPHRHSSGAAPVAATSGHLQATRKASFAGSRRLNEVFGGSQRRGLTDGNSTLGRSLIKRLNTRRSSQPTSTTNDSQLPTSVSVQQGLADNKDADVSSNTQGEGMRGVDQGPTRQLSGRFPALSSYKRSSSSIGSSRRAALHKLDSLQRMANIKEDADTHLSVQEDDVELEPSPFHSLQLSESASNIDSLDEGRVDVPLTEVSAVNWLIARHSWVYLCVAFIQPLITQQIRPIAGARQAYADSLGQLYTQVLFYAQTVGALIGSQLIPTYLPESRRRRLLAGLTGVLLLFIPGLALVLHFSTGPEAFIPLVFILFLYSGYVNSSVYALAYDKLESVPDDRRVLQMIMTLTTAVSSVVGSCLAFLWVKISMA